MGLLDEVGGIFGMGIFAVTSVVGGVAIYGLTVTLTDQFIGGIKKKVA